MTIQHAVSRTTRRWEEVILGAAGGHHALRAAALELGANWDNYLLVGY